MPAFPNPISTQNFQLLVEKLFKILQKVAMAALAICIIFAGYLFATGEGNPEKIERAKKAIFWGIVGAGIAFLGEYLAKMIIEAIT